MGEVYGARDTRLEREVAIKILPAGLSSNPSLRQRLEREAKAISKLSHPNICILYDIGRQDGVDFLVMELVDGITLEQRLRKGPLPSEQAIQYSAQIADALSKAHKLGITHRDLKPSNIMLTKNGAKLMDFGLAKQAEPSPLAAASTETTMEQSKLTSENMLVGTLHYMAPEQLEGKEADSRTDIFALGEVLYEMVTGRPAFGGRTKASLIAAILRSHPQPITEFAPTSPPALNHVVMICLAKDPEERWQSASDVVRELRWIAESGGQRASLAPAGKIRELAAWLISLALLVALIVMAIWFRNPEPSAQIMYFSAPFSLPARDVVLAPNGHTVALVGYKESARRNALWIYEVGSSGARDLPSTEGASYPFWSADGRSLAFFADGKLKRLDLSGGQVQILCDAPSGRGGSWNKDGVILFTPVGTGSGLYQVSAAGGTPTQVTHPDSTRGENSHRWPMFLPDGTHYLYMAANFAGKKGVNGIFVGSLDSNEKRLVVEADANAAYAAPGYLLFYRDKSLFAQRFDLRKFALTGEPTAVLTDIEYLNVARIVFAVSDQGVLVAQTGSGAALSQPVWFDRKGKEMGAVGKPDVYGNIVLAPNERSVAVNKTDTGSQNTDVWTYELTTGNVKRLTFDSAFDAVPIWSPDAARLVFTSNRQTKLDLYMKKSDGAQEEKVIVPDPTDKIPNDWSRDGRYILYAKDSELWFFDVKELRSSLFVKATSALRNAQFSPDRKWVAYASNESGRFEIYVTSFPDAHGRWQVSNGGGEQPRWRGDGKELFYLSPDDKMMAVPVKADSRFDTGGPVQLFQATPREPVSATDVFAYDVTRDGQRFLVNTQVSRAETQPISVILHWTAKLSQ